MLALVLAICQTRVRTLNDLRAGPRTDRSSPGELLLFLGIEAHLKQTLAGCNFGLLRGSTQLETNGQGVRRIQCS